MAPNRLQSRAAVHAIRGLVFTTSFSVVLLAEERRRRIKLARSAVDNARKLHTVRTNRAPTALTEMAMLDDYRLQPLETGSNIDSSHFISRSKTRSKKRRDSASLGQSLLDGQAESQASSHLRPQPSLEPSELPTPAKEGTTIPVEPFLTDKNLQVLSEDVHRRLASFALSTKHQHSSRSLERPDGEASSASQSAKLRSTSKETLEPLARDILRHAEYYLAETPSSQDCARALHEKGLAILDRLVAHLNEGPLSRPLQDAAIQMMVCLGSLPTKSRKAADCLTDRAAQFLIGSASHGIVLLPNSFHAVLSAMHDRTKLLARYLLWLVQHEKSALIDGILQFDLLAVGAPRRRRREVGRQTLKILRQTAKAHINNRDLFRLYEALQKSGLFSKVDAMSICRIRLYMAASAQDAGDMDFVAREVECLSTFDLAKFDGDFALEVMQDLARLGQWSFITSNIRSLDRVGSRAAVSAKSGKSQSLRSRVIADDEDNPFCVAMEDFVKSAGAKQERNIQSLFQLLASQKKWDRICATYTRLEAAKTRLPASCLQLVVQASISRQSDPSDHEAAAQEAFQYIRRDHRDACEASTPALMKMVQSCEDPLKLLHELLRERVPFDERLFNKAANVCISRGYHGKAQRICALAANQCGDGLFSYSEYNFSNMLFTSVATARYDMIRLLIAEFTSQTRWLCGSKVCKEAIKHARKTIHRRADDEERGDDPAHVSDALRSLDQGLEHAKKCRAEWGSEKKRLVQTRVGRQGNAQWQATHTDPVVQGQVFVEAPRMAETGG